MTDAFRIYGSKSCRITRRFQSDALPLAAEAQRSRHEIFLTETLRHGEAGERIRNCNC